MGLFLRRSVMAKVPFVAPPIVCAVTLSGAIGPAFGFSAADTDGQTFSITAASAGVYLASSPFASAGVRRALPAAGKKCWIQTDSFALTTAGSAGVRAGFIAFTAAGDAIGYATVNGDNSGAGSIAFYNAAGSQIAALFLPQGVVPYLSFGIDDSGELYFYRADTEAVVLCSDITPAFAGVLSTADTLSLFGFCDASSGGASTTCEATFTTDQASMIDIAEFTGDEDWCGNAITVPLACTYPFGATLASGDFEGGNSDPMTLSNNDQTMSCVLTGTPANEFEAFPEGLWADRATTGGLTFTPALVVVGMQLKLDTLPAHSGGGSGFTVAYAANLAFLNKAFDDRVFVTVEATDDGRFYPALRNVAGTYVWEALSWVDNVLDIGLYHDPVGDRWGVVARTVTGATTTATDYGYIAALDGYGMSGEMYGFVEIIEGAAAAGTSGETLTVSVLTDPTTWDLPFPAGTQGVCSSIS